MSTELDKVDGVLALVGRGVGDWVVAVFVQVIETLGSGRAVSDKIGVVRGVAVEFPGPKNCEKTPRVSGIVIKTKVMTIASARVNLGSGRD